MVVDSGAIAHLAQLVGSSDAKLKRQIFSALSQISKHSLELAEMVVEAELFPAVLISLKGTCVQFLFPSSLCTHMYTMYTTHYSLSHSFLDPPPSFSPIFYMYMCTCVHVYMYMYVSLYIHTCIEMCVYMHIRTCIYYIYM